MNFFPLQQASRNVIEIYMLIHRADKAENRCFSYFCFALQMDSKRHKSPCSRTLPGSPFLCEPPALSDSPVACNSFLFFPSEGAAKITSRKLTVLAAELRHSFLCSHQGRTLLKSSLMEQEEQPSSQRAVPVPTFPTSAC